MKALVPTGDPQELVRLEEVPDPAPGPDEIVIGVEAFSVNRGETFLLRSPRAHWRPGQDVAGRVLRSAPGGPPEGSRVLALLDQDGWAEQVAAPLHQVVALPDAVSTVTGAALPLAGMTALRLVRAAGPVIGARVLLTGASGGVGHLLTQLLVASGAEVVAVTASQERGRDLIRLGAAATVREVSAAGPVDIGLDSVGGDVLPQVIAAAGPDGRVLWYGQASGRASGLDLFATLGTAANVTLEPFSYHATRHARRDDLATLVRLVADGRLEVPVGVEAPWSETSRVLGDLAGRRIVGKAVLTMG